MCLAYQSGSNTGIWDMTEGGGVINGREYSQQLRLLPLLCRILRISWMLAAYVLYFVYLTRL